MDIPLGESRILNQMEQLSLHGDGMDIVTNFINNNGESTSSTISNTQIASKLTEHECVQSLTVKNVITDSVEPIARLKQLTNLHLEGLQIPILAKSVFTLENLETLNVIRCQIEIIPQDTFDCLPNLKTLDLSHNNLKTLQFNVGIQIVSLVLENNCLKNVKSICSLYSLKELNLDSNRIKTLPGEISKLTKLEKLSMANNMLQCIPKQMANMRTLKALHLHNNKLTNFPFEITMLTSLEILQLNANNIKVIPSSISNMIALTKFNMNQTGLSILPEELGKCDKLEQLWLKDNAIENLPESIKDLVSLETLVARANKLSGFPKVLVNASSIQTLYLEDNNIKEIPKTISEMRLLQNLYLTNTGLSALPEEIGKCNKLEKLWINNNAIQNLPESISDLVRLETLVASKNKLSSFPKVLVKMSSIKNLYLEGNNIKVIPKSISDMRSLQVLNLKKTGLSALPEEIGKCNKLEKLGINDNAIEHLPESIKDLVRLETLVARANKLSSFPKVLVNASSIQTLYLEDNNIKEIPNSISEMRLLQNLYLTNTGLSALPEEIGKCNKLEQLWINNNAIQNLPESISDLVRLETLVASKNKLSSFPKVLVKMLSIKNLHLDGNNIKVIPKSISDMQQLQVLDLKKTGLSVLPGDIGKCDKLEQLLINNNALENLPESMSDLVRLETLVASENKLSSFPTILVKMLSIKHLYLSGNNIKEIPTSISEMRSLQILDVNQTGLSVLPEEIGKCSKLEKLWIDDNAIVLLPESMKELTRLEELAVRRNKLSRIRNVFVNMLFIKNLYLEGNNTKEIPTSISLMRSLEFLGLNQNRISFLPEEIGKCNNLVTLMINENALENLPESMKELTRLEELVARRNKLTSFPKVLVKISSIKNLYLEGNHINEIPASISQMKSLEILDLISTGLSGLPEEIGKCNRLKKLCIDDNALEHLPESMQELTRLEELSVRRNKLTTIPKALSNMTSLKSLNVEGNKIEEISITIKEMSSLEYLDLSYNHISKLPKEIRCLISLQEFHMEGNKITSLPVSLKWLTKLKGLYADDNDIEVIPDIFNDMGDIDILSVEVRNIKYPPQVICKRGVKAIAQFYKDYKGDAICIRSRTQIHLLGESMAGKTSLANCLSRDIQGYVEPEANRTVVLQHFHWTPEENIVFRINDFGGHNLYKITYHIFQSEKSINLILFDLPQYDDKDFHKSIGFWLERLLTSCPFTSDVFFVGTKIDGMEEDKEIDKKQMSVEYKVSALKAKFLKRINNEKRDMEKRPSQQSKGVQDDKYSRLSKLQKIQTSVLNMKFHYHTISCKSGVGVEELHESLCDIGRKSCDQIPESWKNILRRFQKYFNETEEMCVKLNDLLKKNLQIEKESIFCDEDRPFQVLTNEEMNIENHTYRLYTDVLSYLHQCGEMLWYSSVDNLKDFIFPNIQRFIDVLKTIFHHDFDKHALSVEALYPSKISFEQDVDSWRRCGKMTEELLERLLASKGMENIPVYFVRQLLVKFNIWYVFAPEGVNNKPSLLMPWFLKETKPHEVQKKWERLKGEIQYNVTIIFKFRDNIPETFFERMVVLSAVKAASHSPDVYIWKGGLYCRVNKVRLLLETKRSGGGDLEDTAAYAAKDGEIPNEICTELQLQSKGHKILDIWDVVFPLFESISMYIQNQWPGISYGAEMLCPHCIQYNINPCDVIPQEYFGSQCPGLVNVVYCKEIAIPAVIARPVTRENCSRAQARELEMYEDEWHKKKYENGPFKQDVIALLAKEIGPGYTNFAIYLSVKIDRILKIKAENPSVDRQISEVLTCFRKEAMDRGKTNEECFRLLLEALDHSDWKYLGDTLKQRLEELPSQSRTVISHDDTGTTFDTQL